MKTTLSSRLQAIYEMVPTGIAADVGADHGKLIISLLENHKISLGVAIENKKGPYERLLKAVKASNFDTEIMCQFADGISELPSNVDIVIIAGMGGFSILKILEKNKEKLSNIKTIIVDAHNASDKVREGISNLGYFVKEEEIVFEDDVFYEIIRFDKGHLDYLMNDYQYGPILRKEKPSLFYKMWERRLEEIDSILSKSNISVSRQKELEDEKERIKANL